MRKLVVVTGNCYAFPKTSDKAVLRGRTCSRGADQLPPGFSGLAGDRAFVVPFAQMRDYMQDYNISLPLQRSGHTSPTTTTSSSFPLPAHFLCSSESHAKELNLLSNSEVLRCKFQCSLANECL